MRRSESRGASPASAINRRANKLSEKPPPKGLAPPPESCDRAGDSGAFGAGSDSEAAATGAEGSPRVGPISVGAGRMESFESIGSRALRAPTSRHASGPHVEPPGAGNALGAGFGGATADVAARADTVSAELSSGAAGSVGLAAGSVVPAAGSVAGTVAG